MKTFKEFQDRMEDKEFAALFSNAETDEEIIKIAADQGYELTLDDVQNFEMTDDMLEAVAGGKYEVQGDMTDTAGGETTTNFDFNFNININD